MTTYAMQYVISNEILTINSVAATILLTVVTHHRSVLSAESKVGRGRGGPANAAIASLLPHTY